jgi:hypothetical protein
MKLMSDFKKNYDQLCNRLDLKPRLLVHICLVGSLFEGSYISILLLIRRLTITARPGDIRRGENSRGMNVKAFDI